MSIITFLWLVVAVIIVGSAIARAVIRWQLLQLDRKLLDIRIEELWLNRPATEVDARD